MVVIAWDCALPPDARVVPPHDRRWASTDFDGAALDAIVQLAARKEYRLVHTETAGMTAFFVSAELAHGRFPVLETVPAQPPWDLPNGYDHAIHASGRGGVAADDDQLVTTSVKATP